MIHIRRVVSEVTVAVVTVILLSGCAGSPQPGLQPPPEPQPDGQSPISGTIALFDGGGYPDINRRRFSGERQNRSYKRRFI